jgi:hypothetical protein
MVCSVVHSKANTISSMWLNGQDGRLVAYVEAILEELVLLQSSCPTFRHLFESQQATQAFIQAFRSFMACFTSANEIPQHHIRISEKLMHFGLTLSLDNAVSGTQKREVCLLLPPSVPS